MGIADLPDVNLEHFIDAFHGLVQNESRWRGGTKIGLILEIDIDTPCVSCKEISLVNKGVVVGCMARGFDDLKSVFIKFVRREEVLLRNGFNLPVFERKVAQDLLYSFPELLV
jgi:hypothetical protein